MKKLLLILMIVPMIGFGQEDYERYRQQDSLKCYTIMNDFGMGDGISPDQLIDILSYGAQYKDTEALEFVHSSQYNLIYRLGDLGCEHINEFQLLLEKKDLSNREIKTLNRYISQWSNLYADYVSPVIEFGGKEYIIVGILTSATDEEGEEGMFEDYSRTLLFTNNERGSNDWMIILHPEKQQKSVHKFFKNEKNWNFDRSF